MRCWQLDPRQRASFAELHHWVRDYQKHVTFVRANDKDNNSIDSYAPPAPGHPGQWLVGGGDSEDTNTLTMSGIDTLSTATTASTARYMPGSWKSNSIGNGANTSALSEIECFDSVSVADMAGYNMNENDHVLVLPNPVQEHAV